MTANHCTLSSLGLVDLGILVILSLLEFITKYYNCIAYYSCWLDTQRAFTHVSINYLSSNNTEIFAACNGFLKLGL